MTQLPPLKRWESTAHGLHQASQILAALRLLTLERSPNYLELGLAVYEEGLSTGPLSGLGEVTVNFETCALDCTAASGNRTSIPLQRATSMSLFEAALDTLEAGGWRGLTWRDGTASPVEAALARLESLGHPFPPTRADLTSHAPLAIDPARSADYAHALYRIFTAAARFRASLVGSMTPIVVWPEHFDLSFLWFSTETADAEHPHMNFGFAPFADDSDRPYLYDYAYPMPDGFEQLPPPNGAGWHTAGWQGVTFPYDTLAAEDDPEARIEAFYTETYRTLSPSRRPLASAVRS
jgi:hypothetical protein